MGDKQKPTSHKDGEGQKESSYCHIHIEPEIQIDIVDNLKRQHETERREDKATSQKQIFWTKVAAALIFAYTFLSYCQVKIAKDTFNAANRPYIGIDRIDMISSKRGDDGKFYPVNQNNPSANAFEFRIFIKNFGPVPGTNYRGEWEAFVGGVANKGKDISFNPTTIFPGQTIYMSGQGSGSYYSDVMLGTKSLVIEVKLEYDGPSGHYKECVKSQYIPELRVFGSIGTGCK